MGSSPSRRKWIEWKLFSFLQSGNKIKRGASFHNSNPTRRLRHSVPECLTLDSLCLSASQYYSTQINIKFIIILCRYSHPGVIYIWLTLQLHAVSCTQQGRQREPSVKTHRSSLSAEVWRHCVLSGGTQSRSYITLLFKLLLYSVVLYN